MSNFDSIKALISQMAGSDKYITVNSTFVHFMGELEGGVFLSQLIYWSDKGSRADGWFYKKDKDWETELGIKRRAIERNIKTLKERGILSVKVMKDHSGVPTKHYRINDNVLQRELLTFIQMELYNRTNGNVQNDISEMSHLTNGNVQNDISSYTEITTENTTKIKEEEAPSAEHLLEQQAQKAFRFYEQHFGMLNPSVMNKIDMWLNEFDVSETGDILCYAMEQAAERQKQWPYAQSILKDWAQRNARTLNDVQALQAEFKRSKGGRASGSYQGNVEQRQVQSNDGACKPKSYTDKYLRQLQGETTPPSDDE